MGNLALLNGKLSPKVSNGPCVQKRDVILTHSALALNQAPATLG